MFFTYFQSGKKSVKSLKYLLNLINLRKSTYLLFILSLNANAYKYNRLINTVFFFNGKVENRFATVTIT